MNPPLTAQIVRLRDAVLRDPAAGLARLEQLAARSLFAPDLPAALHVLRAEAYRHLGEADPALDAAKAAMAAVAPVADRDPDAVEGACGTAAVVIATFDSEGGEARRAARNYVALTSTAADADRSGIGSTGRMVYAAALKAVVDARTSCTESFAGLRKQLLSQPRRDTPVAVMLREAVAVLASLCEAPSLRRTLGRPPPVPGGVWQPDLSQPDHRCLAWLLRAHPVGHTCPPRWADRFAAILSSQLGSDRDGPGRC